MWFVLELDFAKHHKPIFEFPKHIFNSCAVKNDKYVKQIELRMSNTPSAEKTDRNLTWFAMIWELPIHRFRGEEFLGDFSIPKLKVNSRSKWSLEVKPCHFACLFEVLPPSNCLVKPGIAFYNLSYACGIRLVGVPDCPDRPKRPDPPELWAYIMGLHNLWPYGHQGAMDHLPNFYTLQLQEKLSFCSWIIFCMSLR